jgi:hypothetical protein
MSAELNLEQLKALALVALDGPRTIDPHFAAAANPTTVLALIAEIERLRTPLPVQAGEGEANAGRDGGAEFTVETAQTRMDTGFEAGAESGAGAGGEDGWISVEDRLPEGGETVLAWAGDHIVLERWMERHESPVGWCSVTIPIGPAWDDHEFEDITHWMPLPSAPRATPAKANDGEGT